jgi:predicted membrane metal-binding protein
MGNFVLFVFAILIHYQPTLSLILLILFALYSVKSKNYRLIYMSVIIVILKYISLDSYLNSYLVSISNHFKNSFSNFINSNFELNIGVLLTSITIGVSDKSIDRSIYNLFKEFNLLHLISISGANFGFLANLATPFNKLISKKKVIVLTIIIQTYYYLLIGFLNLPASRAFTFSLIENYSIITGRPAKYYNKILLTLILIAIFYPNNLLDRSLLLSLGFSIFYFILGTKYLAKIFNSELKKLVITFFITTLIFNSQNPDLLANISFALLYPFIFIGVFISYVFHLLNLRFEIIFNFISAIISLLIQFLNQLSSSHSVSIQIAIFILVLALIFKSTFRKTNVIYEKFKQ